MFRRSSSAISNNKHVRWAKRLTSFGSLRGFKIPEVGNNNVKQQYRNSIGGNYDEYTWARVLNTKLEIENSYKLWSPATIRQDLQSLTDELQVQLFAVVLNGRLDLLEAVLTQSEFNSDLINSCDSKGRSLLHLCVVNGHTDVVTYLLQKGAEVECWDAEKFSTPLICACATGNLAMIEILLAHGADVNAQSEEAGRTPLHWAVASGHVGCVEKLIDVGAREIATLEPEGVTPFLLAVIFGHDEVLKILVRNGADISSVLGESCDSALHISSIIESVPCTKVLLNAGILPDVRNIYGETPLHLADTTEVATLLLSKGANVNAAEINGMTPLHFAVLRGNINVEKTKLLIFKGAEVNAQSERGETPLFLASTLGTPMKVCYLLNNGANVTVKNTDRVDSYAIMKTKMPHVIQSIGDSFDQAVTIVANDPSDLDCMVSLDFCAIGMEAEKEITRSRSRNRNSKIVDINNENFEANLKVQQPKHSVLVKSCPYETEFLNRLILDGHKEILAHPLIESFLSLKWERARHIFYSNFAFYMIMAILYTIFTMESFMKACPPKDERYPNGVQQQEEMRLWSWFNVVPQTQNMPLRMPGEMPSLPKLVQEIIKCDITWKIVLVWCILILATWAVIMKEVTRMIQERMKYFKAFENLGEWIFIFSILATSVWGSWTPCNCTNISDWHYPTAAVGLLISWTMILVRIGKFPHFGLYVQMLGKVLKNFGGFLLVYLSILNAFALAFCVLFPKEPAFASYPLAMLKIFTMMTGEMGYDDLFYAQYQDHLSNRIKVMSESRRNYYNFRSSDSGNKTVSTLSLSALFGQSDSTSQTQQLRFESDLFYRICTSHLLYCLFVAVVSISLMNLLVALAVNDIQDLQIRARVDRLCKQTSTIHSLERFVFSKLFTSWLPKPVMSWLRRVILLHSSTQKCKFIIRPNDPNDVSLSEDLKKKIMDIAVRSFETTNNNNSNSNKRESVKPKGVSMPVPVPESLSNETINANPSSVKIDELKYQVESLRNQVDVLSKTLLTQMETVQASLNLINKS